MNVLRFSCLVVVGAVCGVLGSVGPARCERELMDHVVAVVEDDAIFASDVEQMVKRLLVQQGVTSLPADKRETLMREALDELINAQLIAAKAAVLGIEVSFGDVEDRVDRAIEDNKNKLGGEKEFKRQLESEDLTVDGLKRLYREQIRNRMVADRVLRSQINPASVVIDEADLVAEFEKRKDRMPPRPAVVHLRTIFVAMQSSESARAVAREKIAELRRRIMAGEDFGAVATEASEDPSAEKGGSLGTLRLSDLADKDFADAAAALAVGEVSEPVLTSYGFHLIQVTAVDTTSRQVDLRHILVRITPGEDDVEAVFRRASEVRAQIEAGAPFDSMAIRFSDDKNTAEKGGDLGWLRLSDLPEFFRDVLSELEAGEVSPVLREPGGFRIVRLIERETERPFIFEEVRDELYEALREEKLSALYIDYFKTLRGEFYVDVPDN